MCSFSEHFATNLREIDQWMANLGQKLHKLYKNKMAAHWK